MDIEAQIRDIISEREPYLYEVLHENRDVRTWRGPLLEDKLWKPQDDTVSLDTPRSSRLPKNITDHGSIYTIDKTSLNLLDDEMKRKRKNPKRFLPSNMEQKKEREYIQKYMKSVPSPYNISEKIMHHFYQAPKVPFLGYGMPRPETKAESVMNCRVAAKPPGIVVVSNHKSLRGVRFCQNHQGTNGEYCDILGPGSCSACIEETNRFIAEEIQHHLYPRIDLSQNCLVLPKLSKTMRQGHMKQVRKHRLSELCIADEVLDEMPKREQKPLSQSVLHTTTSQNPLLPFIDRNDSPNTSRSIKTQ
ncbi:hypothetical protein LOTGIDRAFT_236033 [Lottia gigantea]|uniref:Uncharacterized protein n=1 Tax=Lottia gigantea TaxID=225164 RepID=V4B8E0_LOTGI|nr:hypothetical protein LOTGIDRAFT_236033 [Lottia gigantea]ESO84994.1 hypothetical protein LOTGIDRAFT_236033 [Lottia gigantea]